MAFYRKNTYFWPFTATVASSGQAQVGGSHLEGHAWKGPLSIQWAQLKRRKDKE